MIAQLPHTDSRVTPWLVLVDFDGTITERDGDFQLADALLPEEHVDTFWELVRDYEKLEISMKDYFEMFLEMLGQPAEVIAKRARRIKLRKGVKELVEFSEAHGHDLKVVSEGLDLYVHPALEGSGLERVLVTCNHARFEQGRWVVEPGPGAVSCERCMSCKGEVVRQAHDRGQKVALIGNGASDLCAAREADMVAARDSLLEHCVAEGIDHVPWNTLADAVEALRRVFESEIAALAEAAEVAAEVAAEEAAEAG